MGKSQKEPSLYSLDYAKTRLSTRAWNQIKSFEITDLRELTELSKIDLRRKSGIGVKTFAEIILFCDFLGIKLKDEETHIDLKQERRNTSHLIFEKNIKSIGQLSEQIEIIENLVNGLEPIDKNYRESDQTNHLNTLKQAKSHLQSALKIINDLISGEFLS